MEHREALVTVVRVFTLVAVVAIAIPFASVFIGDEAASGDRREIVDISELVVGTPLFVEISAARPLIVMRASAAQRQDIAALSEHVWSDTGADPEQELFVYWALSTGRFGGCRLRHEPRASQAARGALWRGGYWAPGCEASYDYAGRAIRNPDYAYASYVGKSRALRSPTIEVLDGDRLAVSMNSR